MTNEAWITPDGSVDPTFFNALPVKVKTRAGHEDKGWLTVQEKNDEGQIRILATYNSSPFANTVSPETFYLTQEQLDDLQKRGANCVLIAPPKKPN
jgi:hypothetical protein